jgi:hypothetical protein
MERRPESSDHVRVIGNDELPPHLLLEEIPHAGVVGHPAGEHHPNTVAKWICKIAKTSGRRQIVSSHRYI